jgi:hypothetical protein
MVRLHSVECHFWQVHGYNAAAGKRFRAAGTSDGAPFPHITQRWRISDVFQMDNA